MLLWKKISLQTFLISFSIRNLLCIIRPYCCFRSELISEDLTVNALNSKVKLGLSVLRASSARSCPRPQSVHSALLGAWAVRCPITFHIQSQQSTFGQFSRISLSKHAFPVLYSITHIHVLFTTPNITHCTSKVNTVLI